MGNLYMHTQIQRKKSAINNGLNGIRKTASIKRICEKKWRPGRKMHVGERLTPNPAKPGSKS